MPLVRLLTTSLCLTTPYRVLACELLSLLAGALLQVSLAWWMASRGGATDLARYGVLYSLGSLLAMPLLSPLVDRYAKINLIRLGLMGLLLDAALMSALAAHASYRLSWLLAGTLLSVLAHGLLQPALACVLAEQLPATALAAALRLRKRCQAVGRLLGPALAGTVLALGGLLPGFLLGALFLLLALALASWSAPVPQAANLGQAERWLPALRAGLRAKWGVPLDRYWTLAGCLMMVCFLPATSMLVPLKLQSLGLGAAWLGACEAALSGGLLLGTFWLADKAVRRLGRWHALLAAVALCGVGLAMIGPSQQGWTLLPAFAAIGLGLSVTQLVGQTHRMLAMPPDFRARMTAVHLASGQLSAALGPLLAGLLLAHLALHLVYHCLALGFAVSALLLLRVPGLKGFLQQDHVAVTGWYARHHPQAFG